MPTPIIIGITGGSGAGKSTLARAIESQLGKDNVAIVQQDWYYRNLSHLPRETAAQTNFDHPDALDLDLLAKHLELLQSGQEIEAPQYDFSSFSRLPEKQTVLPSPILILDGLFVLSEPDLRKHLDLSVYIDVPSDIRLIRRIRRDRAERGYSLEHILESWETRAHPMFEQFVAPQRKTASYLWKSLEDNTFVTRFMADLVKRLDRHGHRPTAR